MKTLNFTLILAVAGLLATSDSYAQRGRSSDGDGQGRRYTLPSQSASSERQVTRNFPSAPSQARASNNVRMERPSSTIVNRPQTRVATPRPDVPTRRIERNIVQSRVPETPAWPATGNNRNNDRYALNNRINNVDVRRQTVPSTSNGSTPTTPTRTFDQRSGDRNYSSGRSYSRSSSYSRYSNYNDRNSYYNTYNYYNTNCYYRSGYRRPIYFMYAPRYSYRPYHTVTIYYGGYPYYYSDGFYYDYYSGYYQPIYPPFGMRIRTLPFGYTRLYIGINPFYYFNGIFYRQYRNAYEVVDAPLGATVSSIPEGAKMVVINGETFYELNGTYFKEQFNEEGATVYVVVGKHGEINNSYVEPQSENNATINQLHEGDIINALPADSKIITLDGEKLYLTPDGTYLKVMDGDKVRYQVVGH